MSDIFAGQGSDPARLAELYDLEHDVLTEDLPFWRELAARHPGRVLDLGCGSGRLFRALIDGGAAAIVGLDGSAQLLRRAADRIAADDVLAGAAAANRIDLVVGDVRHVRQAVRVPHDGFSLVIAAGVVPHLDGPEGALEMLEGVAGALGADGRVVLDTLGPAQLPHRDLPLSIDWERATPDGRVVRRSEVTRRDLPDGLHVAYSTLTDTVRPDGTIARLPASFRLWYPSTDALDGALDVAGLAVELTWGSYDLEPFDPLDSERRIIVAGRR